MIGLYCFGLYLLIFVKKVMNWKMDERKQKIVEFLEEEGKKNNFRKSLTFSLRKLTESKKNNKAYWDLANSKCYFNT